MEQRSDVHQTILYSPEWDGNLLAPWVSVRSCFAYKVCSVCGCKIFPRMEKYPNGTPRSQAESQFKSRMTCGQSCAKKLKNPMHSESSREKMRETLLRIGHKPIIQGGNGRGMTLPQRTFLLALGEEWVTEFVLTTKKSTKEGYPHHYKLDLANVRLKVAIELDGMSHCVIKRKEQDHKKDCLVRSLGWKVLRLKNKEAMSLYTTYGSQVIHHILQMAS